MFYKTTLLPIGAKQCGNQISPNMTRFDRFSWLCVCALWFLIVVCAQDEQPEPDDPDVQREKHEFFRTARTACAMEFLVPYGKQRKRGRVKASFVA